MDRTASKSINKRILKNGDIPDAYPLLFPGRGYPLRGFLPTLINIENNIYIILYLVKFLVILPILTYSYIIFHIFPFP